MLTDFFYNNAAGPAVDTAIICMCVAAPAWFIFAVLDHFLEIQNPMFGLALTLSIFAGAVYASKRQAADDLALAGLGKPA